MNERKRYLPSPSMAVALTALCVALGGTGLAVTVAANSVNSRSIVNGSVKRVDIGNGAINRPKIANNSINSAKVANGSLSADDLSGAAKTAIRGTKWALVAADGTVVKSSGGITVTKPFNGEYRVNFGSPTSGRLILASVSERENTAQPFTIQVSACGVAPGPTSDGYVNCQASSSANIASVLTARADTGAVTSISFYIALMP